MRAATTFVASQPLLHNVFSRKNVMSVKHIAVGTPFGRLRVVGPADVRILPCGAKRAQSLCVCECGATKPIDNANLRSGKVRSCGCLVRDTRTSMHVTHGAARAGKLTPEYIAWRSMTSRCDNPGNDDYHNYGGRGISYHPTWSDFAVFFQYVGHKPSPKHSLDRFPNQNGNYEPGNVRWATPTEQGRNKRNNILLTFGGETLCLTEMADKYGMKEATVRRRIAMGWSTERSLTTPLYVGGWPPKPNV